MPLSLTSNASDSGDSPSRRSPSLGSASATDMVGYYEGRTPEFENQLGLEDFREERDAFRNGRLEALLEEREAYRSGRFLPQVKVEGDNDRPMPPQVKIENSHTSHGTPPIKPEDRLPSLGATDHVKDEEAEGALVGGRGEDEGGRSASEGEEEEVGVAVGEVEVREDQPEVPKRKRDIGTDPVINEVGDKDNDLPCKKQKTSNSVKVQVPTNASSVKVVVKFNSNVGE